jgi:hypothetical protein
MKRKPVEMIANVRNIKKVHKPATEATAAHDVLEFKVESSADSLYDQVVGISDGYVRIQLEPNQGELNLDD